MIDRPKGGFLGWIGESTVCAVHRRSVEIRFQDWPEAKRFNVVPTTAFKRLFFDGLRGYFSIGISVSGPAADAITGLPELLLALSNVPMRSAHRPRNVNTLHDFPKLALDLYASGSVRKLKDLKSESYKANVRFGKPVIVVSMLNAQPAADPGFDRTLNLNLRSPVQLTALGQETFGGFAKWPDPTFVFVISSRSRADAANSRFLRAGVARLYLESYSLERLITVLQGPLFEECDDEGRNLIATSVNDSLRRLHGAEKPDIAATKESYDALVATFARIFRPGHVSDFENILKRLQARPNLRKALQRSLLVDTETSLTAITKVEVVMGDKIIGDKVAGDKFGGDKVAGDKIGGNKTTENSGILIEGDAVDSQLNVTYSREQISNALAPIATAIAAAPPEKAAEAKQKLKELEDEAAKGKGAKDTVVAKLLEGLVGLVPTAVSAVAGAFGTPILAGIAGPATKYVLDKLQGK